MTANEIRINSELSIPVSEIGYRASRSGGPGGQHVNTSSTRVELVWNVTESHALTTPQRDRILTRLAGRISGEGILSIASSSTRSQHRNRQEVTERFAELVRDALHVPKRRKKTMPSRAAREARLRAKKQRSRTKELRKPPRPE